MSQIQEGSDLSAAVPSVALEQLEDLSRWEASPARPTHPEPAVVTRLTVKADAARAGAGRGMAYASLSRVGQQLIQFGGTIVLAHLLLPRDYGLAAIVYALIGYANVLGDLGIGAALIQREKLDERLLSTAFWVNAVVGVILAFVLVLVAWPVAHAYGEPHLAHLFMLAGLTFALTLTVVPQALLERALLFNVLAKIELGAALLTLAVSVTAASAGMGATSLVLGPVVAAAVSSACMLWAVRWLPRHAPSRDSARILWQFGSGLFASNSVIYWGRNGDNLLVGAVSSTRELGFYSRAYTLMLVPINQMGAVLGRVLFPVLSRASEDRARFKATWLRAVRLALTITLPIALGMAVAAPAMIESLYGPKWRGMSLILTLLALSAPPQLLATSLGAVFQALGETRSLARRSFVMVGASMACICAGLPWGVEGVCTGFLVGSLVVSPVLLTPAVRLAGCTWREVLEEVAPQLTASGAMVATGVLVRLGMHGDPAPAVFIGQIVLCGLAYGSCLWILGRETVIELLPQRLRGRLARTSS